MSRIEEMKKEDSKNLRKYIIGLVICGLIGGVVGGFCGWAKEAGGVTLVIDSIANVMYIVAPFVPVISVIISTVIVAILYKRSRRQYEGWDGEDEDVMEAVEKRNEIALIIAQIQTVLFYAFIAVAFYSFDHAKITGVLLYTQIAFFVMGFLVNLVFITASQQKIVNFEKEMNPEKNGSVYDSKFREKWLESCDEAEKHQIYKAAFASYKVTNYTCIGAWLISLLAMVVIDTGLFPVVLVCAIWLISSMSYCLAALKKE